jgi:hypothetical protein
MVIVIQTRTSIRDKILSWSVVGAVIFLLLGTAIAFTTSNHPHLGDFFYVLSGAIFLSKFLTWEDARQEAASKRRIIYAIAITLTLLFLSVVIAGNHRINPSRPAPASVPPVSVQPQPSNSQPDNKSGVSPEAGGKKRKPEKPNAQNGEGNVSIDQHTEGNNSPITNSPITINPPVNPNAPIVTYDFGGVKHTQMGNRFEAEAGEQTTIFQELATLEKEGRWDDLRNEAESQIKAVPTWLTPYLFAAEAYANLGNKPKAIELCEYVKKQSGGNPNFDKPADGLLRKIKP